MSTPFFWPVGEPPSGVTRRCPSLSGSGKLVPPWLRKQAEYARGPPELDSVDDSDPVAAVVVPTRATFALGEPPPQAAASSESPTRPASASPRSVLPFSCERAPSVVCVLRATI